MKRVATKEDVIAATRCLIAQRGIRAIGVDQIAESLGMSKRTLYQMFDCKGTLMSACFEQMSRRQQEKIRCHREASAGNALSYLVLLATEYVTGLYHVDIPFLEDISRMPILNDHFEECRRLWQQELARALKQCLREEYLLERIDPEVLSCQMLATFFELRLHRITSFEDDMLLMKTLLRGAATDKGLRLLDS